jgi:hypothetical protein
MALMEEYIPGRTENLQDYLIPTIGDVPPIDTYIIEDREPLGPFGAKGIGEPSVSSHNQMSTGVSLNPRARPGPGQMNLRKG